VFAARHPACKLFAGPMRQLRRGDAAQVEAKIVRLGPQRV
jgi:hypothetical protein